MYSTSSSSKNKSHRNVCRIDLNDGSGAPTSSSRLSNSSIDKSRYVNNSTVNQRPSTSSPMNQNAPLKNYSSFQNLISQLQPSTSKSSKNYSQNKQLLIVKKNEIIKTALKNSLTMKKPSASAKTEHRETGPVKPYAKFEKENELPPDARIKSREKMDQFYSNMKYGRAQSTLKQGGAERNEGIASYVSPKNRSFVQKAVVPNGTVNLSRLSNAHEPRTTNTTMVKYASDPQDPSSSRKDRGKSFDYKQDMSNAAKFHMQNRILLDLDESMNMGPIENIPVKGANTTAHARYSQSKDEIRNVMTPGNYHGSKQRSGSNTRPPKIDFPCKIVREQEKPFQNPKESSPEKEDIFEFENISPIKTNHNRGSSAHNFSSNTIKEGLERAQRNLANQPYPTIIKQINLNSNTPTSGAKPPLYNFPQQGEDVSTPLTTQENEKRYIQDYVKQKSLNIQTVKENKKIEFPGYLQNLTYDRSKPANKIAFNTADHRRSETPNERSYKAPLQPATINFIESLKRNRLSERLPEDHSREYGLNKPSMVTDTNRFTAGEGRDSYGGRYTYDDVVAAAAQKRAEMSNRSTAKTPKNGSLVENFVKQLLENAKAEKMPSSENILPSSVKGTFVHPDKYFIDVADILPKKDKTPQHNIQTPPVLFSNKNQAPEEKESVPRKPSVQNNDINILGIDPAEKEFKMKKFKEDYIIGKQIGQGAYATVRIGVHKPTNTKVAIKIYEKVKIMDPMRSRSVKREIKLMQRIDHQSIIKIYDVVETNNHMNIIMEYIGGTSLHSFLKAQPNRRLKEEHAFSIFKQVVNGLYYCHGRCIAHRDIKLENMLLDSYGNLKIIDFGFSTCIPNDKKVRMFCGTPSYMAPEIVTKAEYCGPPADIWALGVLLYALLCGTFPFKGIDDKDLYGKIAKGEFVIPEFVSEHAQSLLRKMMTVDPDKRPTAKEVMSDPWYVMHAFMDKKTDRRISSRSSSSLDRTRLEKPDSKPNFPSNLNIVQPVGEQQFTQIASFLKSPQNQFQRDEYAKVDIRNIRRKDDDHPRDQVRHLSLNNSRYAGKQNYVDNKNTTYGNIRNSSNLNDGDTLVYEDNADDNKYSFKKTLTENEVWNIPANLSSEKSFQPAFGRNSQMQMSAFQNKSLKRNEENPAPAGQGQGQYDAEIINNLTKMGYKDEEITAGLKEKTGAVYYIYNRMVNERRALHNSNFADSITSDQNTNNNNNNNSFNLSSHMALKRKSVNMAVSKNPQEKENIYNTLPPKTGSTKEEMGASEM